jgi:hypothetical protein
MTKNKKKLLAAAFVVWALGAIWLGAKVLDEFRSGKLPGSDDALSMERIMFPSRMTRDQE